MNRDRFFKNIYHKGDLSSYSFLLTGGAGFIGSNIVRYFYENKVGKLIVLDNLANGYKSNILPYLGDNIEFIEGDILDFELLNSICANVDFVLHQAALGSVPRSIKTPLVTNNANVNGFLNVLEASRLNNVKRVVFASSSSVYGDSMKLPKIEDQIGKCLSPYAVSKKTKEEYAAVYHKVYGLKTVGLRYFNVYGPNQSPNGPYAAVLPLFMQSMLNGESPVIHGDGGQSRDFTFVENAVQANIRACFTDNEDAFGEIYNIAVSERTTILNLFNIIKEYLGLTMEPDFVAPRSGDVRDSLADISKANNLLGYDPSYDFKEGLEYTIDWYKENIFSMEK